jgi:hypothetical protein
VDLKQTREEGKLMSEEMEGALAEVASVRDTADRLANGNYTEDADHIRVVAGLIKQLAEQVERLSGDDGRKTTVEAGSEDAGGTPPEADAE